MAEMDLMALFKGAQYGVFSVELFDDKFWPKPFVFMGFGGNVVEEKGGLGGLPAVQQTGYQHLAFEDCIPGKTPQPMDLSVGVQRATGRAQPRETLYRYMGEELDVLRGMPLEEMALTLIEFFKGEGVGDVSIGRVSGRYNPFTSPDYTFSGKTIPNIELKLVREGVVLTFDRIKYPEGVAYEQDSPQYQIAVKIMQALAEHVNRRKQQSGSPGFLKN